MPSIRFSSPGIGIAFLGTLLLGSSLAAGEVVHLSSGFDLQADSHILHGAVVELRVGSGSLEIPVRDIQSIQTFASPTLEPEVTKTTNQQRLGDVLTPEQMILQNARAQGMDAAFVRSVARIESGLVEKSISQKGALGLMQLMPMTARELGVNPFLPNENVRGGVQYLRSLLLRYHGDSVLALAAYNAGPGAVQKCRGVPPYWETRQYVISVLKEYNRQLSLQKALNPNL